MGQTILTSQQSQLLELVASDERLAKRFYLMRGTALAEFYYQHRLSEDLDFFSPDAEIDPTALEVWLKKHLLKIRVTQVKKRFFWGW